MQIIGQLAGIHADLKLAPKQPDGIDFVRQPLGEFDAGEMGFRCLAFEAGIGQAGVDQLV
ncbi:hypothetical protein SDC9_203820 [bioreactor metagenome]|uniref:Uncharacterized protein n=1 Tax=bioreactor metagenome TaxID=1076179 RepID=A0A645J6N6_9ZZZZ